MHGILGIHKQIKEFPKTYSWLNSKKNITLRKLQGNILVIDFWTYCCINCIHTLQTLDYVDEKYTNKPVTVIGIHSAKYPNEKDQKNITEAIKRYDVKHPILVDQQMHLWRQYGINAWPTILFVAPDNTIEYKHAGEISKEEISEILDDMLDRHKNSLAKVRSDVYSKVVKKDKDILTLSYPGKLSISQNGSLLAISDSSNNRIIICERKTGKIVEIIGSGYKGMLDSSFDASMLNNPQGICFDKNFLYIADTGNHSIRVADLRTRHLITIAGNGDKGIHLGYATKYIAKEISLVSPWDVAILGRMLYITMAGTHQIWAYNIEEKTIIPFAGNGLEEIRDGELAKAMFAQPSAIAIQKEDLYIADSETSSIRSINIKKNYVSTIIGIGLFSYGMEDGSFISAKLQHPLGICVVNNDIYIADTYNSAIRVIRLNEKIVETLIKKDATSYCDFSSKECDVLGLYEPSDVKYYDNKLYIADTNNHLVRIFDLKTNILSTFKISR